MMLTMAKQIIKKGNVVKCVTSIPYSQEIIKQMKAAGYKITTIEDDENEV